VSTEPSATTPDTKPSADSAEFEDFFEQGALAAHEDGRVRAEQQQQAEDFDVPLITPEQLARRARLRRAVGLLVTGLGVAFLVLFASRGLRGPEPALSDSPVAKDEPAQVPVKAVATSLGAARPQPAAPQPTAPVSLPMSAPKPAAREVLASPAAPPLAAPVVAPVVHRTSGAHALAPVPAAESPRRPAAAPGSPPRAASAPARAALASRPSRAAEPPTTASFPVDPR